MALVGHGRVVRRLVHHGDHGLGRAVARRIPRYARPDDDREIHVVPERFDVGSLIKRMILGEVGEQSAGLLDHRQSEPLAQRDQSLVGFDLLAGALGEHDRVLRLGDLGGELFDVFRRSQHARRGRDRARIGRGRPAIHQRFRRNGQVSGSGRLPLRQLAGADDAFIERVDAARDRSVFDDRVDQVGRAAWDAEVAYPLGARIELRLLAVGHRLSGDHHHRHSGDKGAVDAHGALQQAGARMQQYAPASGRWPACSPRPCRRRAFRATHPGAWGPPFSGGSGRPWLPRRAPTRCPARTGCIRLRACGMLRLWRCRRRTGFFMVGLPERIFVARSVSRLNAQDYWRTAHINSGAALSSDEGVVFTPGFY